MTDELSRLAQAYKHAFLESQQSVTKARGRVVFKINDIEEYVCGLDWRDVS